MKISEWKGYIWPSIWIVWSVLIALQIVLSFFLYNPDGNTMVRNLGLVVWILSAIFGWVPMPTLRKKGGVAKGKSYIQTTVLVKSGIYAVVRHPQYLAVILLNLALILIVQNLIVTVIGFVAMVLGYLIAFKADQDLVEKFGDDYERYMKTVPRMNFVTGLFRLALRKQNRE